jgi:hypothetical protein
VGGNPARAWRRNGGSPRTHALPTPYTLTADIALPRKTWEVLGVFGSIADIALAHKTWYILSHLLGGKLTLILRPHSKIFF